MSGSAHKTGAERMWFLAWKSRYALDEIHYKMWGSGVELIVPKQIYDTFIPVDNGGNLSSEYNKFC